MFLTPYITTVPPSLAMEKLPDYVLLEILSRLDDSADVARCRVASKAFDTVLPGLRSINLKCSLDWYDRSSSRVSKSQRIKPFKSVFVDLISKLESVESVRISLERKGPRERYDFHLTAEDFVNEWLPRVSVSLKSLQIFDHLSQSPSNVLALISEYCHILVTLKLDCAWLSVHNMNPMPMLTTLTLSSIKLEDENLNQLNMCFPNLQVLYLQGVEGLKDPKIHLLHLKTCYWAVYDYMQSLTLITPNLISLEYQSMRPAALHVEAPMLLDLDLFLEADEYASPFSATRFNNLKTVRLDAVYFSSLLSEFPISKTVEDLTLELTNTAPSGSKLTLGRVFTVFPNLSSLCINSSAWSDLEDYLNPQGWEISDGSKGLKTFCVYLELYDPLLTFSYVACVLDQCVGLLEVSLLIHTDVDDTVSKSFRSKCMARWPGLKWRWGVWNEDGDESWITI